MNLWNFLNVLRDVIANRVLERASQRTDANNVQYAQKHTKADQASRANA